MIDVSRTLFVSAVCWVTVKSQVRTINSVEDPDKMSATASTITDLPGFNASQLTATLCSNSTVQEYELHQLKQSNGANFYLTRKDLRNQQEQYVVLHKFTGLLTIPEHLGLHEVMIFPSNMSVEELEAALYFAWMPSIELHMRSTGQNASAIRILSFDNPDPGMTDTGISLHKYTYTIIVSGTVNGRDNVRARHSSRYPVPTVAEKISSPVKDDFIRDLKSKGVMVYQGLLFPESIVVLRAAPQGIDFDHVKRDLISDLETLGDKPSPWFPEVDKSSTCNMSKRALDMRAQRPEGGLITSVHGRYTQFPVAFLRYMITVRNKLYISRVNLPSATGLLTNHVSIGDVYPKNKTLIFPRHLYRLYSSGPVNFQLLPLVEKSITRVLNNKLMNSNVSVIVHITDPDLNNATTIQFWIALAINGEMLRDLDPRLFYGRQVYDHLEGLRVNLAMSNRSISDNRVIRLSAQPFVEAPDPQRERFFEDCKNGPIRFDENRYGDCPVTEAFSLHLMQISGDFPTTQQIMDTVKQAFTEANSNTLNDAEFVVSLKSREDLFRTIHGLHIVRFDFTFSYSNLTNENFWNVWRFPTDELLKRLSLFDPPLTPGYFLRKPASSHSAANDTNSSVLPGKSESSHPDAAGGMMLASNTFKLFLVYHGAMDRLMYFYRYPDSADVLRAVGDAFTEANPGNSRQGHLNVSLTGHDDRLWTVNGQQVSKFEFTVAYPDNEPDRSADTWQYPTSKILQQHLQQTASANFATDPVY